MQYLLWLFRKNDCKIPRIPLYQILPIWRCRFGSDNNILLLLYSLWWRHIRHGVSVQQPLHSLLKGMFRSRSDKQSELHIIGILYGKHWWIPHAKGLCIDVMCFYIMTSSCICLMTHLHGPSTENIVLPWCQLLSPLLALGVVITANACDQWRKSWHHGDSWFPVWYN